MGAWDWNTDVSANSFDQIIADCRKGTNPAYTGIFHHVRKIPYGAVGGRDPMAVLQRNLGSCSGKHALLRDLLRSAGYAAEVITIRTYFNRGIPDIPSMDPELREMITRSTVLDFHHYVRLHVDGKLLRLDATWDDSLIHYGFPVNHLWDGDGDTKLAASPLYEFPEPADLGEFKAELLLSLPEQERTRRDQFFFLLTQWMASIRAKAA